MTDLKSSLHFHESHHRALNALDQVVLESFPSWVNNSQVEANQAQPRARKNWEKRPSAKSRLSNSPIDKRRTRFREETETYGPSNQLMQNISNDEIQISEKNYTIRTKSRDRGSPERNNEGSFIGSEASFTSSNFLRKSQKNEQVPNRLSNGTLSPREIDDHIILSPLGSQYRTLTPIGEVNEQGSLTAKSSQKELAKIFGDPNLVTIAASSRRISITKENSDSPQPNGGRKKADDAKNMLRRGSEKKQFAEDEYCKIMMQQQHPNLVIDLDDDVDDVINKSLSYVLTINKEEGNSINTRTIDQHQEPKDLGEPIQKKPIDAEIATITPVKAQSKRNSRKQMEAYAKIQEPQIQLQFEEEETKIENKSNRKAISKLVQASDPQSDANSALLKKAEPTLSNKKKKKESRFNSLFFKRQSTYVAPHLFYLKLTRIKISVQAFQL